MSNDPILKLRKQINPYFHSLKIIIDRLLWDFKFESFKSRVQIKKLKDFYQGEKAIILCNGPSLKKVNFSKLNGSFIIGLNKINLLFDRTDLRPNIIVSVNKHVVNQNLEFFKRTEIPVFLGHRNYKQMGSHKHITYLHTSEIKKFAQDCSFSVNEGGTVTYVALQLAFHMGFSEVALVGCDHYFNTNGPANKEIISEHDDSNHFDKDYFGKGLKWQLPDIPQSEYSYHLARSYYLANNRKIYNCTEGGYLEIFERKPLDEFLSE